MENNICTSSGTVLQANPHRNGYRIQNMSQNPLFVLFGLGASAASFNVVLKGNNGLLSQESGVIFTGPISVSGNSPCFSVFEHTS